MVLGDGTDADVVAFAEDELEAAVQVFHVRGGRVRGQRGWVIDKVEPTDTAQLVERFLTQFYGEQAALAGSADDAHQPVPREILVPELPAEADALAEWLSGLRGSRVQLRVPQRGDKRALAETVARNAAEAFTQHKLRRAGDLTARSAALQEIQDALGLDTAPLRIECIDVSHVQGSDVVASLVVFEDGLARKSEYRRFEIRGGAEGGDVAAIAEVVRRRFRRYLAETRPSNDDADDRRAPESCPAETPDHRPGIDPETGRPAQVRLPAEPAGRRRRRAAGRGGRRRAGRAGHHRRRGVRAGQAAGGGLAAGRARPGDPVAHQRGALPAAARPRRGAPVRHHLPPAASVQGHDQPPSWTPCPGWGRPGGPRCSSTSARCASCRRPSVDEIAALPGFGPRTAAAVLAALHGEPTGGADTASRAYRRP